MPLLNYTTSIPVERTLGEIHKCLAGQGAQEILTGYDGGLPVSVAFSVVLLSQPLRFRLPADWRPILVLLQRDRKVPRRLKTKEQAIRVSWRIIKDWVEAQMALIATKMVTIDQVFLPYALAPDGRTMYDHAQRFLLPAPQDE